VATPESSDTLCPAWNATRSAQRPHASELRTRTGADPLATLRGALAPDVVDAIEQLVANTVEDALAAERAVHADDDPEVVTYAQAARILDCTPDAVRMRAKRGRLDKRYHGGRVYITRASLRRLDGGSP
jgi:hypothetical protein